MGISNIRAGHRSQRATSHPADEPLTLHSILHHIRQHIISRTEPPRRRRSWTPEQLSDDNYLKVPASVWKNIHSPHHTEWVDAAEDTLTSTLAAGAIISSPIVGLCKVDKYFWDKSIETKCRKDTYRYRVMEHATDTTILPMDDEYDPADDESKIKILFVGLRFTEHTIFLLRRICPDVSMEPILSTEEWRQYLSPSIRQGYTQIKRSTTYGWAPVAKRNKKKGRRNKNKNKNENNDNDNAQLPTPAASSSPPSEDTGVWDKDWLHELLIQKGPWGCD